MANILALLTDAFGGFGGIAQYNRDFLLAMSDHPTVDRIVVVPRNMPEEPVGQPSNVETCTDGLGGWSQYVAASLRACRSTRPDVVLCGHVNLLPVAAMVASAYRVPLALLIYGIEVWQPIRLASQLALSRVDHIVTISHITFEKMCGWSPATRKKRCTVIPNAIDLARFQPTATKPSALEARYGLAGRRVLMTLARLVARERYKGVDEVLELLPKLRVEMPDLAYLVVGDGVDLPRLRAKAVALGVAEHVVFAGKVSEQEKIAHYQLADVFVMPGRGEGFGFVFLEALACGVPVVASVLDGSREAVRGGLLGELCDPRDEESITTAIYRAAAKSKGLVPNGLEFFEFDKFRARVHAFTGRLHSKGSI